MPLKVQENQSDALSTNIDETIFFHFFFKHDQCQEGKSFLEERGYFKTLTKNHWGQKVDIYKKSL
jgi:hypothetical protein